MIEARELIRDGNSVWVSGDMLPFSSDRLESLMHRFVCAGHDKLVIDFRGCRDVGTGKIEAAHRLARTALFARVKVSFIAESNESKALRRSGINSLMSLITVGESWQDDMMRTTAEPVSYAAAD